MTARIIRWVSLFTLVAYVGLFLFEGFTASMVICGVIAQLINLFLLQVRSIILGGKLGEAFCFYPSNVDIRQHTWNFLSFQSFPFFALTSPAFLATVAMVVVNHWLAFQFFGDNYYPFSEVSVKLLNVVCGVSMCMCVYKLNSHLFAFHNKKYIHK